MTAARFLLALALFAGQAKAAELLAVETEFAKVFERTPSGEFVGLGADVVRALAHHQHDSVRFEIYPWPRAQAMVELGQADIPRNAQFDSVRLRYNQAFNELVDKGNLARLGRKHDVQVPQ